MRPQVRASAHAGVQATATALQCHHMMVPPLADTSKDKCIYCGAKLRVDEPYEHIIPESIGGRSKSRHIVCETCNQALGSEIDSCLCDWDPVLWCRSVFLIPGKSGKVPHFYVTGPDGRKLCVGPGLRPAFTPQPPSMEETSKSFRIVAPARTEAEARKRVKEVLRRKRERSGGVYSDLEAQWEIRKVTYAPVSQLHSEVVYDPAALGRAIAKTCLNFAALSLPNKLVLAPCFDPIRKYVAEGSRLTPLRPVQLEYRPVLRLPRCNDSLAHRVALYCSNRTRSSVCILELFGKLRWVVVLSWNYEGPELGEILTEHPTRKGAAYSIHPVPIEHILVESVLRQTPGDLGKQEARFKKSLSDLSVTTGAIATHEDISGFLAQKGGSRGEISVARVGRLLTEYAEQTNALSVRMVADRLAPTFARETLASRALWGTSEDPHRRPEVRGLTAMIRRQAYTYTLACMLRVILATRVAEGK